MTKTWISVWIAMFMLLAPAVPWAADVSILESYVGRDLRNENPHATASLRAIIGKPPMESPFGLAPWYVWRMGQGDHTRYVVFEGQRLFAIPGTSSAAVHLFNAQGAEIESWSFSTGWRIDIVDASVAYSKELATHLLTIHTTPVINGRHVAKQVFAFSGDALRFIRMEDAHTNLISNTYTYPNHTLGISVAETTEKEWTGLLESKNQADVLSALVFLGGSHMDPEREETDESHEDRRQARLFRDLMANQKVRDLVEKYRNSNIKWVREAADMVMKPKER